MASGVTGTSEAPPQCGGQVLALRKAAMGDLAQLLKLINAYAAKGIMLPRTEFEIAENLRDFSVIEAGAQLAGCCALHFYGPLMGEVRSLAVAPEFQRCGAGRKLVLALEEEAQAFQLQALFAFTYIPRFFEKLGYREIDRGELPLKAWKDCLRCPKFQCCDEIAVIKYLEFGKNRVMNTPIRGVASPRDPNAPEAVQLPVIRKQH